MEKIPESMTVEDPEPEPKVVDEPESGSEVVAELVLLQEEIFFSQSTEVEELPIETLVDFPAELITELVPSLVVRGPHYP